MNTQRYAYLKRRAARNPDRAAIREHLARITALYAETRARERARDIEAHKHAERR